MKFEKEQPPRGEGQKFDNGKARWDLLSTREISEVVQVLTDGAKKYADNNWKKVEHPKDRYYAAACRHLIDGWRAGELIDPESGRAHLAHAICCLVFLMWFDNEEKT